MSREALVLLAGAFAVGLIRFVPYIIATKSKHLQLDDVHGKTFMPWGTTVFLLAFCAGFAAFGTIAIFADARMTWVGLCLVALCGYGAWCTVLASKEEGSVSWDDQGIQGPRRIYPFPFSDNRGRISWESILSYQDGPHGLVILRSKEGKKLVWSSYYAGASFLRDLIRRKCPSVEFK